MVRLGVPPASRDRQRQSRQVERPGPSDGNIDMSPSTDPDGAFQWYFMGCGDGNSTVRASASPFGTCRYDTTRRLLAHAPGPGQQRQHGRRLGLRRGDAGPGRAGYRDPAVSITSPISGAHVSGSVSITANASDNFGVRRVDFFVDLGTTSDGTAKNQMGKDEVRLTLERSKIVDEESPRTLWTGSIGMTPRRPKSRSAGTTPLACTSPPCCRKSMKT